VSVSDAVAAGVAAAAPRPEPGPALGERISDRLNPILVREVQQALNGRSFVATLGLSLLGIVVTALVVASGGDLGRAEGRGAFVLALQVLAPILLLVVPFQAYLSMRQEVAHGTVEHLLLSRLTPGAIVRGKLAAATVQSLLFLAVFAPLVALTWLLRGVDVPTIAFVLGLAFVYAFGAAALAVAMGALSRWAPARALPMLVLAVALCAVTLVFIGGMRFIVRDLTSILRDPDFGLRMASLLVGPVVVGSILLALVASNSLAHPHENRSTSFRVFALAAVLVGLGWTAYAVPTGRGVPSRVAWSALVVFAATAGACLLPFWWFAVTEDEPLSPRARTLVPRSPVLAALAIPLLPGGGRGLLFTILVGATAVGGAAVGLHLVGAGTSAYEGTWILAFGTWGYGVPYAGLGRLLRGRLPRGARGTVLGRVALPLVIGILALLPLLVDLVSRGRSGDWTPMHVLSPVSTIDHALRRSGSGLHDGLDEAYGWLGAVTAVVLLLNGPAVVRGVGEVMTASRTRRARPR
jgi:hypothetical protein